jgi:hypothetical protein
MRQRVKRELTAVIGVVVILAVVVFVNANFSRGALAKRKEIERQAAVSERENSGMKILKWHHMRKTKGTLRKGATFTDELKKWDNKQVNLVGFMVPENTFRKMKEFMLLPLPIECYFCKRPPVRDVMAIQMEEGTSTDIYEQPVLINGVMRLHEGPDQKYFYTIEHAALVAAKDGERLRRRYIEPEHMLPQHTKDVVLEEGIELSSDS